MAAPFIDAILPHLTDQVAAPERKDTARRKAMNAEDMQESRTRLMRLFAGRDIKGIYLS